MHISYFCSLNLKVIIDILRGAVIYYDLVRLYLTVGTKHRLLWSAWLGLLNIWFTGMSVQLLFVDMAGCCQQEKHGQGRPFSAGHANSALTITNGLLVLTYTGGAPCHHVAANRSSIITFICAARGQSEPVMSLGRPHFVNEDDCTYKFSWPTPLACRHTV